MANALRKIELIMPYQFMSCGFALSISQAVYFPKGKKRGEEVGLILVLLPF
jgi:hypothetical protein